MNNAHNAAVADKEHTWQRATRLLLCFHRSGAWTVDGEELLLGDTRGAEEAERRDDDDARVPAVDFERHWRASSRDDFSGWNALW